MTKSEVVNEINKKTGVDKADALKCVEAFMEVVKESLINEENVYLRGFGSFTPLFSTGVEKGVENFSPSFTVYYADFIRKFCKFSTGKFSHEKLLNFWLKFTFVCRF